MSWKATARVKDMRDDLTRSEKFLLLILADYHNAETGQCDPSLQRLADDALMSTRAAQLVLASLQEKGFIEIERRQDRSGRSDSNQYWLICLDGRTGEGETISPSPPSDPPETGQKVNPGRVNSLQGTLIVGSGEGEAPIRGRVKKSSEKFQGEGDPPITLLIQPQIKPQGTVIEPQEKPQGADSAEAPPAPAMGGQDQDCDPLALFAQRLQRHVNEPNDLRAIGTFGADILGTQIRLYGPYQDLSQRTREKAHEAARSVGFRLVFTNKRLEETA